MPVDKPKAGETREEYLEYCIPVEIKSGKDQDQAVAICNSMWENRNMKRTTQQIVNAKTAGIKLNPTKEEIMESPCTKGYRQFGMKIKNGKLVPDCRGPIPGVD